jgi:hypothetical protein
LKLSTVCSGTARCSFEAVLDGQQFAGEFLDGELVGLGYVFLGAAADVFALGLGAQPGVVMFGSLQFQLAELFLDAGQSVGMLAGSRLGDRSSPAGSLSEQGFLGILGVGHARFSKKVANGIWGRSSGFQEPFCKHLCSGRAMTCGQVPCYDENPRNSRCAWNR